LGFSSFSMVENQHFEWVNQLFLWFSLWKISMLLMGNKSTISTGPFSIANCFFLPEGNQERSIGIDA
jgi:hypothetical protein